MTRAIYIICSLIYPVVLSSLIALIKPLLETPYIILSIFAVAVPLALFWKDVLTKNETKIIP